MKMKIALICIFIVTISFVYAFFNKNQTVDVSENPFSIYDYEAKSIDGEYIELKKFKGKKIIIVNVASKCGYTPQYSDLQKLYETYKEKIVILGFPSNDFLWQEPGKNSSIKEFSQTKYGVTFPLFEKIVVKKNKNQHPIYSWLSYKKLNGWNDESPSWNFCKYLINEKGNLTNFLSSTIKPFDKQIISFIENE